MQDTPYHIIHGELVLLAKSPDGDSIRFRPDRPAELQALLHADRLQLAVDGTVQLRLDGIDTPETHYEGQAQPLGRTARDALLQFIGFRHVHFSSSGLVSDATPHTLSATIVAKMVEVNGRPVAYLFANGGLTATPTINEAALKKSLNGRMIQAGLAYPTLYSSTPPTHRTVFFELAKNAKIKRLGVWAKDRSVSFRLVNQMSIGPEGALILPKLFRRCTDYLRAKAKNNELTFLAWLTAATSGGLSEDDELLTGGKRTRLSKVIKEDGPTLRFQADLLDIVFIEK